MERFMSCLVLLWEKITQIALQYWWGLRSILSGENFPDLWELYASMRGFIAGAIALGIFVLSSDWPERRKGKKIGDKKCDVVRVIIALTAISSIGSVRFTVNDEVAVGLAPVAMMILGLIVSDSLKNSWRMAFFFGAGSVLTGGMTGMVGLFLLIEAVFVGVLCAIGIKFKYPCMLQIVLGVFNLVTGIAYFIYYFHSSYLVSEVLREAFIRYRTDMILTGIIILVFVIYDLLIVREVYEFSGLSGKREKFRIKDLMLGRVFGGIALALVCGWAISDMRWWFSHDGNSWIVELFAEIW